MSSLLTYTAIFINWRLTISKALFEKIQFLLLYRVSGFSIILSGKPHFPDSDEKNQYTYLEVDF